MTGIDFQDGNAVNDALADMPGNYHAKRAIQLAAAGGHTITLLGNGAATELRALAVEKLGMDPAKVIAWPPCPCGNFGHKHRPCRCTMARLRKHCAKAPAADMAVECFEPSIVDCQQSGALRGVSEDAAQMFDMARRNHYLSVARTVGVARTVAKLAGADTVQVEHMCEAVQGGTTLALYGLH